MNCQFHEQTDLHAGEGGGEDAVPGGNEVVCGPKPAWRFAMKENVVVPPENGAANRPNSRPPPCILYLYLCNY